MARQQTTPTPARDAFVKLEAKLPELYRRQHDLRAERAKIERVSKAGVAAVMAVEPPDASADIDTPAMALLNGAATEALPGKMGSEGARLHGVMRDIQIVDRAVVIAQGQLLTAAIAASRESGSENLETTRELHRQRALLLISLLQLNEKIETHRVNTAVGGICADGPMEGFTARLFGVGVAPTVFNLWPRKYLAACLAAAVISKKEFNI